MTIKATKTELKKIINGNKDKTCYFTGELTYESMWEMFRYRYSFGEAETVIILSALELAGAKFKKD